ncbi:MAG: hypothetical protein QOD87_1061 [Pseudonocardiales bacterium]|jgi:hypothetical protein|nr:hypothetical protein [Pseudonocardiales bacterium]
MSPSRVSSTVVTAARTLRLVRFDETLRAIRPDPVRQGRGGSLKGVCKRCVSGKTNVGARSAGRRSERQDVNGTRVQLRICGACELTVTRR